MRQGSLSEYSVPKIAGLVTVVALIVVGAWMLGNQSEEEETVIPPIVETITPEEAGITVLARAYTVPVAVTRQFFYPTNITARVGDTVTLDIISADTTNTLSIPALAKTMSIPGGERQTLTIPVNRRETMVIYCAEQCEPGTVFTIYVE